MKKAIILFVSIVSLLTFVSCGKNETELTTTLNSGYVNNDITTGYVENYDNTTTYFDNSSVTNIENNISTTVNSVVNTTALETEATALEKEEHTTKPLTTEKKGLTPSNVESSGGIEKVTYTTNDKTYIVYYTSELLGHDSKFPIISWANGTGCPPSLYDGLLREMASAGFIVIASDETMAADGTAQIAAIDFIIEESKNNVSALYKKVNTSRIGVMGHSQGGRSSVNAGAMDDRITCVLSLAGSNFTEEAEKLSKPVLFMAGSKDKVVDAEKWLVTAYDAVKGPAVYASLNGAIHTTCCSNPQAYSSYAISWFNAWFYNSSSDKSIFTNGGELSSDSNWSDFMCKGF